jgi:hypothetical protein
MEWRISDGTADNLYRLNCWFDKFREVGCDYIASYDNYRVYQTIWLVGKVIKAG